MNFGENLKKLRKSKKLSQEELAEKMQVSRQSVSKWETGAAYPEMNNILELCKIFNCHINDLVNDSIIDIDSLDEEIKMNAVKFKKEQQKKMKGLSKAIAVIAKIGQIACIISIPLLIISMVVLGIVANKTDITDGKIIFNDSVIISITASGNKISLTAADSTITEPIKDSKISVFMELLQNNSKLAVIGYIETGFAFLIVCVVLAIIMLKALENLFNNINQGDTPFTLENVGYIEKTAYLMIAMTVLPSIMGAIFESIMKTDLNMGFSMFSLVEILFLFSIAYIFRYGYEIQLDSNGKMYSEEGEENE